MDNKGSQALTSRCSHTLSTLTVEVLAWIKAGWVPADLLQPGEVSGNTGVYTPIGCQPKLYFLTTIQTLARLTVVNSGVSSGEVIMRPAVESMWGEACSGNGCVAQPSDEY